MNKHKVLIKGAGDLASGIALRLHRCGFKIVMTEISEPTTVRRSVAFSPAVYENISKVEEVTGVLCYNLRDIEATHEAGNIAVCVDEKAFICKEWAPDIVVDAILAKRNINTTIKDAELVIGVGPGFNASMDCHCVVETKRGHYIGRCIWNGSAIANTGIPGEIGGYTTERIIRTNSNGSFKGNKSIGAIVKKGDIVAYVDEAPIYAQIDGVVRGILQDGITVYTNMKAGDIDPRCEVEHCFQVSDKASAIAGGVLEGILSYQNKRICS